MADQSRSVQTLRRIFRNKSCVFGAAVIVVFILIALLAQFIASYSPIDTDLLSGLLPPSVQHLMGTDVLGRDIFSRVIYGAQLSLLISIVSVAMSLAISIPLGSFCGFYEGKLDLVFMRAIDIIMAFPSIMLAIALMVILGAGLSNVIIVVAISQIPIFTKLTRAAVLSTKNQEYVTSARAVGESDLNIIFRYILPNCLNVIIVQATLYLGTSILTSAGLGFLGIGVSPPAPEWGSMVNQSLIYLSVTPTTVIFPGLAIALYVIGFSFFGDGLNDVLNPKLKGKLSS
jgi:peptide/nickel transport system permease protein